MKKRFYLNRDQIIEYWKRKDAIQEKRTKSLELQLIFYLEKISEIEFSKCTSWVVHDSLVATVFIEFTLREGI